MDGATIAGIVTLGFIAIGTITGAIKGFTRQIIELIGLVVSCLVAAVLSSWVASFLSGHSAIPYSVALVVGFIAVFVAGMVAFHFVAIAIQKLVHTSILGWLDRACGAVLGLIAATLIVSILVTFALDLSLPNDIRRALDTSTVVNFIQPIAGWMFDLAIPQGADGHIA